MALATARGQHMDVDNVGDEQDYWNVVSAKSTPFYGSAVEVGGIIGGAKSSVCQRLFDMGILMGEIVQLHDDLFDAFAKPAKPDWERPQNNLLMLYVMTADHPDREEFQRLSTEVFDPQKLNRGQEILIRSGAVSFCAYQLLQRYQKLNQMTEELEIAKPDELKELFDVQFQPAMMLLQKVGAEIPPTLFR
jgi:geranylgeranyl pyrophosphate synthase